MQLPSQDCFQGSFYGCSDLKHAHQCAVQRLLALLEQRANLIAQLTAAMEKPKPKHTSPGAAAAPQTSSRAAANTRPMLPCQPVLDFTTNSSCHPDHDVTAYLEQQAYACGETTDSINPPPASLSTDHCTASFSCNSSSSILSAFGCFKTLGTSGMDLKDLEMSCFSHPATAGNFAADQPENSEGCYLAAEGQEANLLVMELLEALVTIKKREDTCERMLRECCVGVLSALQVCGCVRILISPKNQISKCIMPACIAAFLVFI